MKKSENTGNSDANRRIWELRREIDQIDHNILHYLQSRKIISHKIMTLKKEAGLPVHDPEREKELIFNLIETYSDRVDPELIKKLYSVILEDSKSNG